MESDPVIEGNLLLSRSIKINRRKIVFDIILIFVILGLGAYIVLNIEEFKTLQRDVCRLCEQKTGGSCISGTGALQVALEPSQEDIDVNLSRLQG